MHLGVLWRFVPDTLEWLLEDQFRAKERQIRAAFHVLGELTQLGVSSEAVSALVDRIRRNSE